jgi:hypothetical protein
MVFAIENMKRVCMPKSITMALMKFINSRAKICANTMKWFRSICRKFHPVFLGRKAAKKKYAFLWFPDNSGQQFRHGKVESFSVFSVPKKIRMPGHPSVSTLIVEYSRSGIKNKYVKNLPLQK